MAKKQSESLQKELELLLEKIRNDEPVSSVDEKTVSLIKALLQKKKLFSLTPLSKQKIDTIVYQKIHSILQRTDVKKQTAPVSFFHFLTTFIMKQKKWLIVGMSSIMVVLLGIFTSINIFSSPTVMGSNIDPITKSISNNAPLKISFSSGMNHEKTEKAFRVDPSIKGSFSWQENTMLFTPSEPLIIGSSYTATVSKEAESSFGKNMSEDYIIHFVIQGPPEVSYVAPQDITVGKEAKIVIMFNQPMVVLSDIDHQKANNILLDIQPKTEGVIEWIDTSTCTFVPKTHLTFASSYTVKVLAGTTSLDGGKLEKDISFSFETIHPKIVSFEPENGYDMAGPTTPLKVHFNQPINLQSLQEKVTITPPHDIQFSYDPTDTNTVLIQPKNPLPYKTDFTLVFSKEIKGSEGTFTLGEDQKWSFKTVGEPILVSSTPKEKDTKADVYDITLYFSNPMDRESFKNNVVISPLVETTVSTDTWQESENAVTITGEFAYSTEYTFTLTAGAKDIFGQPVKKDITIHFKTKNRDPYLSIARKDYFNLFNGYQNPVYPIKTINLDSIDAYFCEMSFDEFLKRSNTYTSEDPTNCLSKKSWNISTKGENNKIVTSYIDFKEIVTNKNSSGIYYLRISSPTIQDEWARRDYVTFFVSKTSLTAKIDKQKILLWATDLGTGLPVENMNITIWGDSSNKIATGKTNKAGLYEVPMNYQGAIFVLGQKGNDTTLLSRWWNNGIAPWNFGYGSDWKQEAQPFFTYIYTERPIYRPEQKVFFKGIVRIDNDATFTLPDIREIPVQIQDNEGKIIFDQKIKLSALGTFSGELLLDKNASLGQYQISVSLGDNYFYQNFYVEEYKKPEFKVEVSTDKKNYVDNDTMQASINGNYYFGGKLKGNKVKWTISATDYYFSDYEGEWYSFSDTDQFWYCFEGCTMSDHFITSGEGILDQNGQLQITTPLSLKEKTLNQAYKLEATIEDQNNQTVSNRTSFIVTKGNYYVGIRSDGYSYTKGDTGTANIIVLDTEKKPVSNRSVAISMYKRTWNQVKKKNIDGEFYTEFESQDTLITSQNVTTDNTGKASKMFNFDTSGQIVLKVKTVDDKGREMIAASSVFVGDNTFISWYSSNDSRIDLIPDKQEYALGDVAKILIKSPFENAKALLTYERRNILEYKIIDIPSTSTTIEIPITESFIPNTYISVVLMKGGGISKEKLEQELIQNKKAIEILEQNPDIDPAIKEKEKNTLLEQQKNLSSLLSVASTSYSKPEYRVGYTNLRVNNKEKSVSISLTPNKERFAPGETVTVAIETKDIYNKPLESEVSLAVVDESVLALKSREENILASFYGKKDLGVETASSMSIFTDTVLVKTGKAKGGGGGEARDTTRGNFKDTAYFKTDILTNAEGKSTVSFTLPDNLTTWRIIAVAVTKDTYVGSAITQILETKDLIIRPMLPRFIRHNDEFIMEAIIQNGQSMDDVIKVSLDIMEGDIAIQGQKEIIISVPKDGDKKIAWKLRAGYGTTSSFKITATGSKTADSIVQKIPVLSYATPETIVTSGETDSTKTEMISLSSLLMKNMGTVSITVSTSLLNNISKGLEQLIQYPYGCSEQIMSAIITTIRVKTMYEKLGQPLPAIKIEGGTLFENEKLTNEKDTTKIIDMMVQIALQKEYGFQRPDGGWGYWNNSTTSYAHLTAHILYGFYLLRENGYSVDQKIIDQGITYIKNYMNTTSIKQQESVNGVMKETTFIDSQKANERAFALYVLSLFKKGDIGLSNNLYSNREYLHLYAQGYLLLTLKNINELDKATIILKELLANVTEDTHARTAHIEEKTNDSWAMSTDIKSTSILLQGLLELDPTNPMISKIVRYIVTKKTFAHHINTHEISYAMGALSQYISSIHLSQEDVAVKTSINGENVLQEVLNIKTNPTKIITKDIANFVGKTNEIVLQTENKKQTFYYDIIVKYFIPLVEIAPRNNGISINRNYYAMEDKELKNAVNKAKIGDILKAKLTIIVPKERNFVAVESHLPAGFEAVNFNLDTTEQQLQQEINKQDHDLWGESYWKSGIWRFNHIEVRDDRVVLFADELPAGVYGYEYLVRVTSAGSFAHPPATAYEMYFPEIFGRTRGEIFTISE